jgi:hypothetical protein
MTLQRGFGPVADAADKLASSLRTAPNEENV